MIYLVILSTKLRTMTPLRLIITILLACSSLPLSAQELKPAELLAMRKYKMETIDSFMSAKGFEKKIFEDNADFSITDYTYLTTTDSGLIQRSLHVGWQPKLKTLTLQYGVWQKSDAARFIKQLLQDGFKKSTVSFPDLDGKTKLQTIHYTKAPYSIGYKEEKQEAAMLYIFSTDNSK